jgi:cystathionine beta-lyase
MTMNFDFDRIIPREGTDAVKLEWRKRLFGREDILPMWVADMDFAVPPFVSEALKERAKHPIYGYSVLSESYFETIRGWQKRRMGWEIDKEWILFSPGIVTALNLLVETFTGPGDQIIVQPPVYFPFFWAVEKNGRTLLHNQLIEEKNRYFIDFDDLEQKAKAGAKMLILCSPHNPVGRAWTREELERLGEICLEYGLLIISDEIHGDLLMPGQKHVPFASLSEDLAMNTITCIAPSKTFNLAGLFTSSIIIQNEAMRDKFRVTQERIHLSPNIFGMVATQAAYSHGDDWLEQALSYIKQNAGVVERAFRERLPEVKVSPLESTYLMWLDIRGLGLADDEVGKILVEKAGVGLSPGKMFGPGGEGFQRMNIGCPRSILEEATERIINALKS